MNFKRFIHFVIQLNASWLIILLLVSVETAMADDCPPPPPPPCALCPPPTPPDPPCFSCDPPDQIKFADPCAGGDCFCASSPFTNIYIAGANGLQKRTSKGTVVKSLPVLNASTISYLGMGNEQNLYAANYESGLILGYDMEENLVSSIDIKQKIAGQFSIDKLSNIYAVAENKRELVKYDKHGNYLSTVFLPDLVECIDISQDQCMLIYSSDRGEIKSFDLCNKLMRLSGSQSVKLERVNSIKIFPNGEYIVAASADIQRFNSSGVLILKYDVPSHDNWISLTLEPDGRAFWAADNCNSNVWKFDVESGKAVSTFNAVIVPGSIRCILAKYEPEQIDQHHVTKVSMKLNLALQNTAMNGEEIIVSLRKSNIGFTIVGISKATLDEIGVDVTTCCDNNSRAVFVYLKLCAGVDGGASAGVGVSLFFPECTSESFSGYTIDIAGFLEAGAGIPIGLEDPLEILDAIKSGNIGEIASAFVSNANGLEVIFGEDMVLKKGGL